jgi:DNA-binding MarR family transcriptional regulator
VVGVAAEERTCLAVEPPTVAGHEAVDALARQLMRLMRQAKASWPTGVTGNHGLERSAHFLVAYLIHQGPLRTGALAEAVHHDPSTVSRQVAYLVQQGLVERRPDPQDGRAWVLAATDDGERMFEHYKQQRNEYLVTMLAKWQHDEVLQLTDLLDRFNTDFEHYRPQPSGVAAFMQEGDNR